VPGPDGKPVQISQNALQSAQLNMNNNMFNGGHQLANGQPGMYPQGSMASKLSSSNFIRVTSGQVVEIYMSQQFEGAAGVMNGGDNQHMVDGILRNVEKLSSMLDDVTFEGTPDDVKGQIRRRIGGANLTEGDISKLLSVFDTQGVLSSHGGIAKFRTVNDMRDTMNESDAAFNTALDASRQSRKAIPGMSDANRQLMADILSKSASDQAEMSTRVAALLAGTSLTTTAGTSVRRRDDIEEVSYETYGDVGSYKRRTDTFVPPVVSVTTPVPSRSTSTATAPDYNRLDALNRPSIMRQSQSLSRIRKLTAQIKEDEEERKKREAERGERITGLRRAKVPLMVYSCGGFTRCFRIARFYSSEGPPIGINYDRNTRQALNPELNH